MIDAIAGADPAAAARIGYVPRRAPPSGAEPDQDKKLYCTYWIRTGECDYTQQGCLYKHEMPDKAVLAEIGFRAVPRWWQERNAIKVTPTLNRNLARPQTWMQKQMKAADSDSDSDSASATDESPQSTPTEGPASMPGFLATLKPSTPLQQGAATPHTKPEQNAQPGNVTHVRGSTPKREPQQLKDIPALIPAPLSVRPRSGMFLPQSPTQPHSPALPGRVIQERNLGSPPPQSTFRRGMFVPAGGSPLTSLAKTAPINRTATADQAEIVPSPARAVTASPARNVSAQQQQQQQQQHVLRTTVEIHALLHPSLPPLSSDSPVCATTGGAQHLALFPPIKKQYVNHQHLQPNQKQTQGQVQAQRVSPLPTRQLKPAMEELAQAPMQRAVAAANVRAGLAMSKHAVNVDEPKQRVMAAVAAGAVGGHARAASSIGGRAKVGAGKSGRQRRLVSTSQAPVAMNALKTTPVIMPAGVAVGGRAGR